MSILLMVISALFSHISLGGYVFVEDTDRLVAITRGARVGIGHLNKRGDFVHSHWLAPNGISNELFTWITPVTFSSVKVYEYSAGQLIPGSCDKQGTFTPESGGTITKLSEYIHIKPFRPIWNLPGYFVPISTISKTITKN